MTSIPSSVKADVMESVSIPAGTMCLQGRERLYDFGNSLCGRQQVLPLAEVLALVAGERGDGELPLVGELDGDVLGAVVLHVQQQLVLVALANLQISHYSNEP